MTKTKLACASALLIAAACHASNATGGPRDTDESTTGGPSTSAEETSVSSAPTTGSDSTGAGEGTGGSVAAPFFIDLAEQAGVSYVQGQHHEAPDCLVYDDPQDPESDCTAEWSAGGAAAGDYDGDGNVDLYVTRMDGPDRLFRNLGDGTFVDAAADAGLDLDLPSNGAAWGDIDNDGDRDLYLTTISDTRYYLFINDGAGHFTEEALDRGAAIESLEVHSGMTPAFGDFDLDGYLDLYVGEWRKEAAAGPLPSHSRLLRNLGSEGAGSFEDVTDDAGVSVDGIPAENGTEGVYSYGPAFVDLDLDGWPELVIASDFGVSRLFWNNADGTFTDGTVAAGVGTDNNGMGSTFGDYDGDGDLDWFVTSINWPGDGGIGEPQEDGNRLFRNEGDRTFLDLTKALGVEDAAWGWGSVFFDHDNDADLDLVVTNGWTFSTFLVDPMRFWDNDDMGMVERSDDVGLEDNRQGRGLLTLDYDGDGYLDLFIVNYASTPLLYHNEAVDWHDWLRVETIGTVSNRDGFGARVTVRVTAEGPAQVREVGVASHFLGQSEQVVHFGLGTDPAPVAEVRVFWPASGQEQVFADVARNTTLVVEEPE